MSPTTRPEYDYINWPHAPREGYQDKGNNKFLTRGLFLETAKPENEKDAVWCLSEHEVFAHGRWYPSAWMVYIHAVDEYDALRKICGNVRQWERIKEMRQPKDFSLILEDWQAEQAMIQKAALRTTMLNHCKLGEPGYTAAAKMVLAMIDGKAPRGRPVKAKAPSTGGSIEVDDDHERVAELFKQRA